MILFLIHLYKMENTCVCLIIIKIGPNFWPLFYYDSIIKTFCSREQSTSHVNALHTFIELKKKQCKFQNCEILTRFKETFCGVLKGGLLALYFLVSLFSCFDHFIGVLDYSVGRSMRSCYHGVQGKDAFYLTLGRRFKYSDDGKF